MRRNSGEKCLNLTALRYLIPRNYSAVDWNIAIQLTLAQFKLKDQSSFFGFLWSFLHPLLLLAVLFVFFNFRFGGHIDNYVIYLMLALVIYNHFANCTSLGMKALRSTRELTTDAVFPKELLVISVLVAGSLELLISIGICLLLAFATGVSLSAAMLWIPGVIVAEILLVTWVSFLLATVYPFAWDIDHIYNVFLRVLFFITPIFYDKSFLGDGLASQIVALNPLSWVIGAMRQSVIQGDFPPWSQMAAFIFVNVILLRLSLGLFRHYESRFAEHV